MAKTQTVKAKHHPIFDGRFNERVAAGFSGRTHGNMSLYYGNTDEALLNRQIFCAELGIDCVRLVCAQQTHGHNIRQVSGSDAGRGSRSYDSSLADTDALVTNERNLPLAVFTADCLSVFLYSPETQSAGIVHAGWKSTASCICAETLARMKEEFGAPSEGMYAHFGPAIRSCCYEVGKEFRERFPENVEERSSKLFLDLAAANRAQLLSCGVRPSNISDYSICTCCNHEEFFSYRSEGQSCGRMMSVIMLK